MTFSSANSVCIIGTLAESPHAPAVSHRLSVIPISFNSPLLRGLLAVKPTCLSSHSKFTTINWTRILCNTSCISAVCQPELHVPGHKRSCEAWRPHGRSCISECVTHPDQKMQFCSDNGFILSCDDAWPTLAVYGFRQKKTQTGTKEKLERLKKLELEGCGVREVLDLVRLWVSLLESVQRAWVRLCWVCWIHLRVGPCGWQISHCGTP